MNAPYIRVIPRDLFNEASLLKCYGKLALLIGGREDCYFEQAGIENGFVICMNEDGDTCIGNLPLFIRDKEYFLSRPVNARSLWPLYIEDGEETFAVFDDEGDLSNEMKVLLGEES